MAALAHEAVGTRDLLAAGCCCLARWGSMEELGLPPRPHLLPACWGPMEEPGLAPRPRPAAGVGSCSLPRSVLEAAVSQTQLGLPQASEKPNCTCGILPQPLGAGSLCT
uniref:Uncharacterized protein pp8607 n=1 Tax=Homo sapiens TaxID=9606 RepID=Q8WYT6_HUMAN|nr:unknown [Homo sapiens]